MNPLAVLYILSSSAYFFLGVYCYNIGKKEATFKLARVFFLLCLCFALWSFSFAFLHSSVSLNEINFWYDISSLGWCLYSGFILHAVLIITNNESILNRRLVYLLLYGPGIIFAFKEFSGPMYAVDFVLVGYGYSEVPNLKSIWFWLLVIYQTISSIITFSLLLSWGRNSSYMREKKQSAIICLTALVSYILSISCDIVLPALGIFIMPALSPLFLLLWGYGIWYSVSRYKFMSLNRSLSMEVVSENITDLFFILDIQGNVREINSKVCDVLGFHPEHIISSPLAELISDQESFTNEWRDLQLKDKPYFEIESHLCNASGTTIPMRFHVSLVKDLFHDPMGAVAVAKDMREDIQLQREIKERILSEQALRESEERYRHLIENANEIIYKADRWGNFIYTNPAFQKKFGYTVEEICKLNYIDVIPPENRETEFSFYRNQLIQGIDESRRELPVLTKSGKIIWIEQSVKSIKDETGRIIEFDAIVRDITDRKTAEEALRRSEILHQQLLENISDCVYICKLDGHFKYINPAITRLTGFTPDEIVGRHFLSLVHPEYRQSLLESYQKQVLENIETTYSEFPVKIKTGDYIWAGQTVRMIRNSDGEIEFYGITRDITSIKNADDARRMLEEAKSRFFSNISHEIRTPLTLMLGPIEAVLQGNYDGSVDREFLLTLHRNANYLLKLVNNLLDYSKIEAGRMTMKVVKGDIVSFVKGYVIGLSPSAKARSIDIHFNTTAGSIFIYFDPERLDKVIMNLLSNAIKFSDAGDSISITISEDDDNCYIIVSDTGEGIPQTSIESVFERFYQVNNVSLKRRMGTGIGLALAKELVELHGGGISVQSRHIKEDPDNHGTTFTVSIPKGKAHFENSNNVDIVEDVGLHEFEKDYHAIRVAELIGPVEDIDDEGECKQNPSSTADDIKTILIVDDNADMRHYLKSLLRTQYRVISANNGEEGIQSVRRHRPDLVIADVMMPVMNGIEMTSIIKNERDLMTTPVILLTADAELMSKVAGLKSGADDYLHKPFNAIELLTRISSLIKNYEYQQIINRRNREIEEELDVARMLQQRLLPVTMPSVPGCHLHTVYLPMDKVGGDFYTIETHDGLLHIFIADVSGHGLPGAFLATVTKMAFDNICTQAGPGTVLQLLNNVILHHTVRSNFVTAFYAVVDPVARSMRFSCAGHLPPILYRRRHDSFIYLNAKGTMLGAFPHIRIEERSIPLESGDRVVFYTDGITECSKPNREMFGVNRLRETIREYASRTAEEYSFSLMKELELFKGAKYFNDDISMVILDMI